MSSSIEFVDGADGTDSTEDELDLTPTQRGRLRLQQVASRTRVLLAGNGRATTAVLAWALAAIATTIACFQNVFTYRITSSQLHARGGFDASGRSLDDQLSNEHGPRYVIVLAVCAALLAVLAARLGTRALRGATDARPMPAAPRWVAALGLIVTGVLVGVMVALVLGVEAIFSTYRDLGTSLAAAGRIQLELDLGACLWFGIAAVILSSVACAVTAAIAFAAPAPAPAPETAPAAATG